MDNLPKNVCYFLAYPCTVLILRLVIVFLTYNMQIMTSIEVSSGAHFPRGNIARMPSALGQYSRNFGKSASLLIDDDSHCFDIPLIEMETKLI